MPVISCDVAGQFKARDVTKVLAEARRVKEDGTPYRAMDNRVIDPDRSKLNKHYQSPRWQEWRGDPRQACAMLDAQGRKELLEAGKGLKGRQPLKDETILMRCVIIQASPDYFYPNMKGWSDADKESVAKYPERGPLDQKAVDAFWEKSIDALKERYGDYLLEAHLHLDEASPHIHAEIIPYNETKKAISNHSLFPGPQTVRDFHTWLYQKIGKFLGLDRSRENTKRDRTKPNYLPPPELREQQLAERERQLAERESAIAEKERQIESNIQRLDSVPKELFVPHPVEPEKPKKPGLFASEQEKEKYNDKLDEYEKKIEKFNRESDPKWRNIEQSNRIIEHSNNYIDIINMQSKEIRELKMEINKTKKELEFERQQNMQREAAQLKAIPLEDVIERMYQDELYQDKDKSVWKSYDKTRKIGITKNKFIDNYDPNFKGNGAIDFVMHMERCNVRNAIGKLRDYFGSLEVLEHMTTVEPQRILPIVDNCPIQPEPEPPTPNANRNTALRTWLTRDLLIAPKTADYLLETNQIYADSRSNCVVPRPNGGCFMRGTVKMKDGTKNKFKRTSGSKKAGAAVLHGPKATEKSPAILCEGISDALALVDMYSDANVYITGGNLYPDLPPILPDQQILLAFDRDKAGEAHLQHYQDLYPQAEPLLPPDGFNDWNDYHHQHQTELKQQAYREKIADQQARYRDHAHSQQTPRAH